LNFSGQGKQMLTDKVIMEKRGPVGWMTFNNPAKFNAVSMEMWEASVQILNEFKIDADIRVVVVTGAGGKAFILVPIFPSLKMNVRRKPLWTVTPTLLGALITDYKISPSRPLP
jgi:hypothetical protein